MPSISCPDSEVLERFLLGKLSADEVESLSRHVEECARCVSALSGITTEDALVACMRRAAEPLDQMPGDLVEPLAQRLSELLAGGDREGGSEVLTGHSEIDAPLGPATFLAPPKQAGEIGRLGPYRVLKVLGAGGMGVVFLAEDAELGRLVALKAMKPELSTNPSSRQRFRREAQAAAAVKHDHIVTIYQVSEDRGIPYLALEYLEGETLDDRLKRNEAAISAPGPLPIAEVLRIGREIAAGLAAAHQRGLVHRDIKPANIWLESTVGDRPSASGQTRSDSQQPMAGGRVKILDFGLARVVAHEPNLTQSGTLVGTPAYMAPEQARGDPLDHRCDLFSLGCVLYRMCTGQGPFPGKTHFAVLRAVELAEPRPPREINPAVPRVLSDLIMKLLAKTPDQRPPSASAVIEALRTIELEVLPRQLGALGATHPGAVPAKSGRQRSPRVAAFVGLAVLATALFFAPTILHFATNQGELVVEIDDEEVEVAVKQNDLIVRPRSKDRAFIIKAGKGVLEVFRPGEREALAMKEFELVRGGRKIVAVRLAEEARASTVPKESIPEKPGAITGTLPDKEKPFVLLRAGGERDEFATFDDALRGLTGNSVLEVHGNGPFYVPAAVVKDKALVFRAAPGYRPQIHAPLKNQPLLQLDLMRLTVEGCDFRLADLSQPLFAGTGPAWQFSNCRFLVGPKYDAAGLLAYQGPRLTLTNCLVSYPSDWIHGTWLRAGPGKMQLEISNCVILVGGRSFLPAGPDCDWNVTLHNNTVIHSGALLPNLDNAANAKLDVNAVGNIFQLNVGPPNAPATPFAFSWNEVRWEGSNNLYVGSREGLALWHDKEGKMKTYGLAGWEEVWGKKELGSGEAPQFYPAWRELYYAANPQALVAASRSLVSGPSARRSGGQLGPRWDIVGPGEAYVRALAARGEPVPAASLRPKPIEGAPYVVLRGFKVVRDFAYLRDALAWARSGDVVELRTDGPIAGEDLSQAEGPRQITIRAAPGYTPVIRGYWYFANLTLSVEGLHFQGGGLAPGVGKTQRLARVANCTFQCDKFRDWSEGAPLGPGSPPQGILTPAGGALEIVNCVMPGRIAPRFEPGGRMLIHNSLVGFFWPGGEAGKALFEVDRSVLWQPPDFFVPNAQFSLDDLRAADIGMAPEIVVRDSLVDNATRLTWNGDSLKTWKWIGERNVYRLSEQAWCVNRFNDSRPPTSLSRWQALWNSDAGSVRVDSRVYDPLQWKLLPGTPGCQEGRGGKDMGADVSRIATVSTLEHGPKPPAK